MPQSLRTLPASRQPRLRPISDRAQRQEALIRLAKSASHPGRDSAGMAGQIGRDEAELRPGTDEISKIGQKFDRLLESLEGAQKERVAAEKARTLGSLASQV